MAGRSQSLDRYNEKRDFTRTGEPKGRAGKRRGGGAPGFVVQKHDASTLHYDFRLEWDGVLKSWAVAKGPSVNPQDKRLAIRTEDHPLDYGNFEGTIPKGEYGGGTVMLWDRGTWEPQGDPSDGLEKGKLHFTLHGERMHGEWALVRMKNDGDRRENWLLIKVDDRDASERGDALTRKFDTSVASGRTMKQIGGEGTAGAGKSK